MPATPVLWRLWQENHQSEASLGYKEVSCFKMKIKQNQSINQSIKSDSTLHFRTLKNQAYWQTLINASTLGGQGRKISNSSPTWAELELCYLPMSAYGVAVSSTFKRQYGTRCSTNAYSPSTWEAKVGGSQV